MVTTLGSTTLVNAGKVKYRFPTTTNSTLMMSGKNYVQSDSHVGTSIEINGFAEWSTIEAILSMVGSPQTLVTEHDTWTNMYIEQDPEVTESEAPGWFNYRIRLVRHTV